ncbi:hypothetical protein BDR26DRAFT_861709 [Obelidium mucronatum]|nr:hypothetical protein BDR26DRAFT_861709 [Obelidium mucronatum]
MKKIHKKVPASALTSKRITDFFVKKPAATTATKSQLDDCNNNTNETSETAALPAPAPLFDPTDDHEDHLMDEDHADIIEDLDALNALKELTSHSAGTLKASVGDSAIETTTTATTTTANTTTTTNSTSAAGSSNLKRASSKALVFEGDDDDLELLMNASYDFVFGTQGTGDYKKPQVDTPELEEKIMATPKSTRKLTRKSDLLDSILGVGTSSVTTTTTKRALNSSKHTYSLDSLLKDKIKREKQIQEANDIEYLLEASEDVDENSDPDILASKLLPELMQTDQPLAPQTASKRKRKGTKASAAAATGNNNEEDDEYDEDLVVKEDEDADDLPGGKSDDAVRESKKRLQSVVLDMMKAGSVDHLMLFENVEVKSPHIALELVCPENDQIGQLVAKALEDTENCQDFLLSGALIRSVEKSNWYFPDSLSKWLFETACYSESQIMASAAAKNLNQYFESAEKGTWIISPFVFKEVLASYGFSAKLCSEDVDGADVSLFVKALSRSKQSSDLEKFNNYKLPAFNLSLCVELYVSSLTNRWMHYPERSLENAFQLLVKLSIDSRVVIATGDLLAKSVAKIARVLATQQQQAEPGTGGDSISSFQYISQKLAEFAGSDPLWQDSLICKPNSALLGSIAAPTSSGCPTRHGLEFIARIRREVAALCVLRAGVAGGFKKLGEGEQSLEVDTVVKNPTVNVDTSLASLVSIVSKYNVSPARTDYMRLASRIQILAAAVGGYSGVRGSLEAASALQVTLDRLHGSINDSSHLAMDRVWAKENIHDLKTYVELTLPQKTLQQSSMESYLKH